MTQGLSSVLQFGLRPHPTGLLRISGDAALTGNASRIFSPIIVMSMNNFSYCSLGSEYSVTQYHTQLYTKFIHLLRKVGVGTTQNGTSISSN